MMQFLFQLLYSNDIGQSYKIEQIAGIQTQNLSDVAIIVKKD